jgi:hypothetical protein
MKVKELIEKLSLFDQNKRVVVDGYESGYDEVCSIKEVPIVPNPHNNDLEKDDAWWDGEFNYSNNENAEVAILFPRKS